MHLTEIEIALFVEGTSAAVNRERIEHHLAGCQLCVEQVAALARLREIPHGQVPLRVDEATRLKAERLGKRRSWVSFFSWSMGTRQVKFAIAGIALLIGITLPYYLIVLKNGERQFRSPELERPGIAMVPSDGGRVSAANPLFRWNSVPHSMTYRFTLSKLNGKELWSTTVNDTILVLPPSIAIHAGNRYLWRVEVIFRDNTRYRSPIHAFELQE